MTKNASEWGRNTARKRYAGGGRAESEPLHIRLARGMNTASRITGRPYNRGALSTQQNADMVEADRISDAVPRRGPADDELDIPRNR